MNNHQYTFRGISKETKNFIEGSLIEGFGGKFFIGDYVYIPDTCVNEVFPETIGQCTGIRYINSDFIFEGDKIEFINKFTQKKEISKVFFDKGCFCVCLSYAPDFTERNVPLFSFSYKSLKKVGTIYDRFIHEENRFIKIYNKYIKNWSRNER